MIGRTTYLKENTVSATVRNELSAVREVLRTASDIAPSYARVEVKFANTGEVGVFVKWMTTEEIK